MPNDINNILLEKLLNEWLDEWKEKMPGRYLDRFGEQVPKKWLDAFNETPRTWSDDLRDTKFAIYELCHSDNRDIFNDLDKSLKKRYGQWAEKIRGQQAWTSRAKKSARSNSLTNPITWEKFLSQVVDILLEKIPRYSDISMYPTMVLQIEAILESLVPSVYKQEIHGRRQHQSWEEYKNQAIQLLLEGKRQYNRLSIDEQIKSLVNQIQICEKPESVKKTWYLPYLVFTCFLDDLSEENVAKFCIDLPERHSTKRRCKKLEDENALIAIRKKTENAIISGIAISAVVYSLISAAQEKEEKVKFVYSEYAEKADNISTGSDVSEELEQIWIEEALYIEYELLEYLKSVTDDIEVIEFAEKLLEKPQLIKVTHPHLHRHQLNVNFQPYGVIAQTLGYSVEKVHELMSKLKKLLEGFEIDMSL